MCVFVDWLLYSIFLIYISVVTWWHFLIARWTLLSSPLIILCMLAMYRAWMRNNPSGSSEEPVRPVSPQVVTVLTCINSTYVYTLVCIMYIGVSLTSLFIHACCVHTYVHTYVLPRVNLILILPRADPEKFTLIIPCSTCNYRN